MLAKCGSRKHRRPVRRRAWKWPQSCKPATAPSESSGKAQHKGRKAIRASGTRPTIPRRAEAERILWQHERGARSSPNPPSGPRRPRTSLSLSALAGRDAGLSIAGSEHAFLDTRKRTARGGCLSSPHAKRHCHPGMCAPIASPVSLLAFIRLFSSSFFTRSFIHIWFLVLFLGVIAVGSTYSSRFLFTLVPLADCRA